MGTRFVAEPERKRSGDRAGWGFSSAGRAPALQAGGQRFDPVKLHQIDQSPLIRLVLRSTVTVMSSEEKTSFAIGFG
jgi:hypothetical protein